MSAQPTGGGLYIYIYIYIYIYYELIAIVKANKDVDLIVVSKPCVSSNLKMTKDPRVSWLIRK